MPSDSDLTVSDFEEKPKKTVKPRPKQPSKKKIAEVANGSNYPSSDEQLSKLKRNATDLSKNKTIEEIYQKKSQLEHILIRPDTYIGSIEQQQQTLWVFDSATETFVQRSVTIVPGLYKIVDEILVNAADNKVNGLCL